MTFSWFKKQIDEYEIGHKHRTFEDVVRSYNRSVLFTIPIVFILAILSYVKQEFLPFSIIISIILIGLLIIEDNRLETRKSIEVTCRINKINYWDICPKCLFKKYDGSDNIPPRREARV